MAGNRLPPDAVVELIMTMSRALRSAPDAGIRPAAPEPAFVAPELPLVGSDYRRPQVVPRRLTREEIAGSIHDRFLTCFEDDQRYRMLSRHLRLFGLTPDAYRAKWGLPDEYPMMPAFDLDHRAELARQRKLGHYDRSKAKPRRKYVLKAKVAAQGDATLAKPKASGPERTGGGWRRPGGMAQGASPG
ncbi:MucR family transcriptional regulator [Methylobacterium sp. NEAU 140]|uniref:MucR family transcriptional regulator n=1 Tax=Methylobacterium sp. NEAU 140 TaxID=3064945 RepID=UPI00273761FF|nr:MucR family transcriptional regulator [Methylobacterium sp. NEAU 140]MDP4025753.1 MucR family transcriptional regulator [Methylobacterium sp. NEAU 140]